MQPDDNDKTSYFIRLLRDYSHLLCFMLPFRNSPRQITLTLQAQYSADWL